MTVLQFGPFRSIGSAPVQVNTNDAFWAGLPLNTWSEVPNTDPGVYLPPLLTAIPGFTDWGSEHLSGVFSDWAGAAFDNVTGRMFFFGGGHTGSSNNGLYEFNLETLTWRIAMQPSIITDVDLAHSQASWNAHGGWIEYTQGYDWPTHYWNDGKPTALHTYGGMAWRADTGEVLLGANEKWAINPNTGSFTMLNAQTIWISDNNSVYDPVTHIWYLIRFDVNTFWSYRKFNVLTNTISAEIDFSGNDLTSGADAAIVGRKIFFVQDNPGAPNNLTTINAWTLDLDTGVVVDVALTNARVRTVATPYHYTNTQVYSPVLNKYYLMQQPNGDGILGRFTVINPITGVCSEYTPAGTPATPTNPPYGKLQIYERTNGTFLVHHNGTGSNLRVVRLS